MSYYRTASRTGILFPFIMSALLVLTWPELSRWFARHWRERLWFRGLTAIFCASSLLELTVLATPIVVQPPLSEKMTSILSRIREQPGTTVLDLPFCVAGGNGVCTTYQCPQYPHSTTGNYLTWFHTKKVYGVYQGRLTEPQCEIYGQQPYASWFDAWKRQRCLDAKEWDALCMYLADHTELSALLVYPDLWTALREPACASELTRRLGAPIETATIQTYFKRGPEYPGGSRVFWYSPKCSLPSGAGGRPSAGR